MSIFKRAMQIAGDSSRFRALKIGRALHRQAPLIVVVMALAVFLSNFGTTLATLNRQQLALSVLGGLLLGFLIALGRELLRDTAAAFDTIEKRSGLPIIGAAPELQQRDMRVLPPDMRSPLGLLIHRPASDFAQATRQLQDAVMSHRVVAFLGAAPNEGATTAALCAAATAAMQGYRVIVVDCDLRRRSLSRLLEAANGPGVLQASRLPETWRDAVQEEPETGLHFMPAATLQSPWHSLMDTHGFSSLVRKLSEEYDLVVLDCPPALVTQEGPLIARLASARIAVMGWDATPLRTLRDMQKRFPRSRGVEDDGITALYVNRAPGPLRYQRPRSIPPSFAYVSG